MNTPRWVCRGAPYEATPCRNWCGKPFCASRVETVSTAVLPDEVVDTTGVRYQVCKPAVPDADGWVMLKPWRPCE